MYRAIVHQDSVSSIKTIRFQLRTVPEFVNIKKNCTHSMKLLVVDDHLLFREGLRHILLRLAEGIRCGAQGFVSKSGSAEDMLNGLRKVINGEHHIPPEISNSQGDGIRLPFGSQAAQCSQIANLAVAPAR